MEYDTVVVEKSGLLTQGFATWSLNAGGLLIKVKFIWNVPKLLTRVVLLHMFLLYTGDLSSRLDCTY